LRDIFEHMNKMLMNTQFGQWSLHCKSDLHCICPFTNDWRTAAWKLVWTVQRSIAATMQFEWYADMPWKQLLCPSLSEQQIINAFKSDYVAAATAAEARISYELQPTVRW